MENKSNRNSNNNNIITIIIIIIIIIIIYKMCRIAIDIPVHEAPLSLLKKHLGECSLLKNVR